MGSARRFLSGFRLRHWVILWACVGMVARVVAGFAIPVDALGGDSEQFIDAARRFATSGFGGMTSRYPPVNQLLQGGISRWIVGTDGVGPFAWEAGRIHALSGALFAVPLVVGTALLASRLGGRRMAAVAAALVAASPMLVIISPRAMGEPISAALIPWVLVAALDVAREPRFQRSLVLGALLTVLVLTRTEMAGLVVLLPPLLVWKWRVRLGRPPLVSSLASLAVVVALPALGTLVWAEYSSAHLDFVPGEEQMLASSSLGTTMLAGNCRVTLATGPEMGWKSYPCIGLGDPSDPLVERYRANPDTRALLSEDVREAGPVRVAGVALLKPLRSWGLFQPVTTVRYQQFLTPWPAGYFWVELVWGWLALAGSLGGWVVLGRLGAERWVVVPPVAVTTVTLMLTFGNPRYRISIEPVAQILVAALLVALWGEFARRRASARSTDAT